MTKSQFDLQSGFDRTVLRSSKQTASLRNMSPMSSGVLIQSTNQLAGTADVDASSPAEGVAGTFYNSATGAFEEAGPPLLFHPGEEDESGSGAPPPCYPTWYFQILAFHYMAMLRSRLLEDRRLAAIQLGELARLCPNLNILGFLLSLTEAADARVGSAARSASDIAMGSWYDCRHALEALLAELRKPNPNRDRAASALNFLDGDESCANIMNEWKGKVGWSGAVNWTDDEYMLGMLRKGFGIAAGGESPD